jgi:hypothetical protein
MFDKQGMLSVFRGIPGCGITTITCFQPATGAKTAEDPQVLAQALTQLGVVDSDGKQLVLDDRPVEEATVICFDTSNSMNYRAFPMDDDEDSPDDDEEEDLSSYTESDAHNAFLKLRDTKEFPLIRRLFTSGGRVESDALLRYLQKKGQGASGSGSPYSLALVAAIRQHETLTTRMLSAETLSADASAWRSAPGKDMVLFVRGVSARLGGTSTVTVTSGMSVWGLKQEVCYTFRFSFLLHTPNHTPDSTVLDVSAVKEERYGSKCPPIAVCGETPRRQLYAVAVRHRGG